MPEDETEQAVHKDVNGDSDTVAIWRRRFDRFRRSPFLPATVLIFILAAAAGLFAGTYTYSLASPTPHRIPIAVIHADHAAPQTGAAFLAGMDRGLNESLQLQRYDDPVAARSAVEAQRAFAIVDTGRPDVVTVETSGASGSSVSQVISSAATRVGQQANVPVTVTDINPLQPGDPRGLAIFYITLAAVIIGFVGAIQLSVHARALNPLERIIYTIAYAALGGFVIAAVVDWWLGALDLPFAESWFILTLTMFASGMIFTMFNTLFGRWAMIPTWGLMVLLGNPSSGGAVSWPLLPSVLGSIGQWLPPGASVNAQHTAVYFAGHQHLFPFLVLAAWIVVSCTVFWVWRSRHPGGRDREWPGTE